MHFYQGKFYLLFFGLLLICLQTVSAQDKGTQPCSFGEPKSPSPKVEKTFDVSLPSIDFLPSAVAAGETNEARLKDDRNLAIKPDYRAETLNIRYRFRPTEGKERHFDFNAALNDEVKQSVTVNDDKATIDDKEPLYIRETAPGRGFNFRGAIKQSLLFLSVQHGYAVLGQAKTRRALKEGAFFRDYVDSVKSLHGWDDGGRFFTNYIAHPMQGALTGHLYVQNSPQALRQQFSMSSDYWKTRMKAMAWTAAWSTQFEIGPVSQASIGNVGLKGKQTWEDIVTTPTLGTTMLIGEDVIDRYLIKTIERRTENRYIKILSRMLLNPTRNFSNLLRFREPWYRDRPLAR